MQVNAVKQPKAFQPVSMKITFESVEEAAQLYSLYNHTDLESMHHKLCNIITER